MYIMSFFIIGMGILGFIIKPRDIKKYSLVVIIGLTTLAFFFQAKAGDDLNIAFTHLEGLKKNGWEYYSQIASKTSYFNMLPTLKIYFYVISRLPSQHFLPAISIFLIYYCAFWIIIKITNKYKLNATMSVALIFILLITLDYYGLVSGIRNALAYAICAVFLYKDLIENYHLKWRNHEKIISRKCNIKYDKNDTWNYFSINYISLYLTCVGSNKYWKD